MFRFFLLFKQILFLPNLNASTIWIIIDSIQNPSLILNYYKLYPGIVQFIRNGLMPEGSWIIRLFCYIFYIAFYTLFQNWWLKSLYQLGMKDGLLNDEKIFYENLSYIEIIFVSIHKHHDVIFVLAMVRDLTIIQQSYCGA